MGLLTSNTPPHVRPHFYGSHVEIHIGNHVEPCRDSPITQDQWGPTQSRGIFVQRGAMLGLTHRTGPNGDPLNHVAVRAHPLALIPCRNFQVDRPKAHPNNTDIVPSYLTTCTILRCEILSQKASVLVRVE